MSRVTPIVKVTDKSGTIVLDLQPIIYISSNNADFSIRIGFATEGNKELVLYFNNIEDAQETLADLYVKWKNFITYAMYGDD